MLDLCKSEQKAEIIAKIISGEGISRNITSKFNPAIEFTETDMISMLFYLGYLTIQDKLLETPKLGIPNRVMKEIYSDYYTYI